MDENSDWRTNFLSAVCGASDKVHASSAPLPQPDVKRLCKAGRAEPARMTDRNEKVAEQVISLLLTSTKTHLFTFHLIHSHYKVLWGQSRRGTLNVQRK